MLRRLHASRGPRCAPASFRSPHAASPARIHGADALSRRSPPFHSGRRRLVAAAARPKDTVYRGVRYGRAVYVRLFAEGASLVRVGSLAYAPPLRVSGGRFLRAALAPFGALGAAAASLPESAQWEGCEVTSSPSGFEVTRARPGRGGALLALRSVARRAPCACPRRTRLCLSHGAGSTLHAVAHHPRGIGSEHGRVSRSRQSEHTCAATLLSPRKLEDEIVA